jgi:hypothetical protein
LHLRIPVIGFGRGRSQSTGLRSGKYFVWQRFVHGCDYELFGAEHQNRLTISAACFIRILIAIAPAFVSIGLSQYSDHPDAV